MEKKKEEKMHLPKVTIDDFFTTQEERDKKDLEYVSMIPVKEITNFPNHPYQVREDEEMLNMAESIKKFGIIHPVIVRKKENGGYCEDPQNFSGKNYSVSRELGATTNGKTIQNSNRNIRKLNNKCK